MTMMRWDPFRELTSLRQSMDRLLEDRFRWPSRLWPDFGFDELPLDVYQTDKDVVVKATLPDIKPEGVTVSMVGDILTIKGEHREETEVKEENYFRKERQYGSFRRSVQIPVPIRSDETEADFENSVLTITMPKVEEIKPKQIKVKPKAVIEGAKSKKPTTKKSKTKK
jgi:HSP20 family protein